MDRSNIKAAAPNLTSEQVEQLLGWMDARKRVVIFPDNAVSRSEQVKACEALGVHAILPDPMQPQRRTSGERNG